MLTSSLDTVHQVDVDVVDVVNPFDAWAIEKQEHFGVIRDAAVEERLRRDVNIGEVSPRRDAQDLESV